VQADRKAGLKTRNYVQPPTYCPRHGRHANIRLYPSAPGRSKDLPLTVFLRRV